MSGRVEATYDYPSPKDQPRIRKVRREGKRFCMQSWFLCRDGSHMWLNGIRDNQLEWSFRALYRLPEVIAALKLDQPVHLMEGEKDADAVRASLDTTSGVGAATSHWQGADDFAFGQAVWFTKYGSKSPVIVICDNDASGALCGWLRYTTLVRAGVEKSRLSVIAPPWDQRRLKDAHDTLSVGLGTDAFRPVALRSLERAATAYRASRSARYTHYSPTPTDRGKGSR